MPCWYIWSKLFCTLPYHVLTHTMLHYYGCINKLCWANISIVSQPVKFLTMTWAVMNNALPADCLNICIYDIVEGSNLFWGSQRWFRFRATVLQVQALLYIALSCVKLNPYNVTLLDVYYNVFEYSVGFKVLSLLPHKMVEPNLWHFLLMKIS